MVGAGAMGSVLGELAEKGEFKNRVVYWDAVPDKVPGQAPLSVCVPQAAVVFLCVPSSAVRPAAEAIAPCLDKKTVVLTIAKGLEKNTGKTMPRVLIEALPKGQPSGLLSGPMLASELKSGKGGMAVVALPNLSAFRPVNKVFQASNLRLVYSKNVEAVAWAGVLKNIYAVALGIADGIGWGFNRKGWLVTQAIHEMAVVAEALHVSVDEVLGVAGLADLVATGFSTTSRNREAGRKLAADERLGSEGVRSLVLLFKRLPSRAKDDVPILCGLARIVGRKSSAAAVFSRLF